MKPFGKWFAEQGVAPAAPVVPEPEELLPEGLSLVKGVLTYECVSCGQASEWYGSIAEFDIDCGENLCGRSPRCCP